MQVPVSYIVNQAFLTMEGNAGGTTKMVLELISANKEELDIS